MAPVIELIAIFRNDRRAEYVLVRRTRAFYPARKVVAIFIARRSITTRTYEIIRVNSVFVAGKLIREKTTPGFKR